MNTYSNIKRSLFQRSAVLLTLGVMLFAASGVKAQAPAVVGIDHVGINVPDLDKGISFFHDLFGFQPVTKLGPFPMDATWKKNFHIHSNAGEVTIVMMRAGDGSNIELFSYNPGTGSAVQPYRDDISATHFSLYTTDIKATKAYLESKGIKFLSDIMSGGGDTAGESWVYFETPWGASIELNSYPQGKGYEKQHPAVKLWAASSYVELSTTGPSAAELQTFIHRQLQVWNNTDEKDRLVKLREIYLENVSFFDHDGVVNGLESLNARITQLQQKFAGFTFSLIRIDNSNNVIRYYWDFGPVSNPKKISGMDLIILEKGKVRSLNVFIDNLAAEAKK